MRSMWKICQGFQLIFLDACFKGFWDIFPDYVNNLLFSQGGFAL
jgi:hypothetical protein